MSAVYVIDFRCDCCGKGLDRGYWDERPTRDDELAHLNAHGWERVRIRGRSEPRDLCPACQRLASAS